MSGSDIGFGIPGLGVFVARNLTPDMETGLGGWSTDQIVTALTTGVRPDGRVLSPWMPWKGLSELTSADAKAIAAFLKSIPAVKHPVPGPFGPDGEADGACLHCHPARRLRFHAKAAPAEITRWELANHPPQFRVARFFRERGA